MEQGTQTAHTILQWFTDYGALQILALVGLLAFPALLFFGVWAICKIGRPIAKIADWLEEHKDVKTP